MSDAQTPFDEISPEDADVSAPAPMMLPESAQIISPPPSSGGWTIPILCAGLAILACCVLLPQTEDNRRIVYEREKLKGDLERIDRQIATNDEFLRKIAADPTLSERLAQRQMKMIRQGTSVLELKGAAPHDEMSPFLLVSVPPTAPLMPYQSPGGLLGKIFQTPRSKLLVMGLGLMLTAAGLVLGASTAREP